MKTERKPISIEITVREIDAQTALTSGYEDENGNWVKTMSDEEFDRRLRELEGVSYLNTRVVCNGKRIGVVSPDFRRGDKDAESAAFHDTLRLIAKGFTHARPDLK